MAEKLDAAEVKLREERTLRAEAEKRLKVDSCSTLYHCRFFGFWEAKKRSRTAEMRRKHATKFDCATCRLQREPRMTTTLWMLAVKRTCHPHRQVLEG